MVCTCAFSSSSNCSAPTLSAPLARASFAAGMNGLARVVLHDERLVEIDVDVLTRWPVAHPTTERNRVELEPTRHRLACQRFRNGLEVLVFPTRRVDCHSIAPFDLGGRNIRSAPIQRHVAVHHQLSRLPARVCESNAVHDVIEAHLQQAQQVLTGHAWLPLGGDEVLVELALQDAVDVASLLFLFQLETEFALLATAAIARRRAWRRRAPFDSALGREAAFALQEKLHSLSP